MLKGLTIAHISLPIKIFEPKSSIQRIVDMWSFAPKYLKQASETSNHLERFKLVIAFAMSGVYTCTS
jgi:oxysterol-binding protein-related protein 8